MQARDGDGMTRRDILKTTAAVGAAAAIATFAGGNFAHAAASDKLRIGMVGCGGRGTGAAEHCTSSNDNVQIVAMGDVFKDRLDGARGRLKEKLGDKFAVNDDHCFTGF